MFKTLLFGIGMLVLTSCGGTPSPAEEEPITAIKSEVPGDTEQVTPGSETWIEAVRNTEQKQGFLPLYLNEDEAKILAAFPAPDSEGITLRAIHAAGLSGGLGSNPIGLDRGLFDSGSLIAFRRVGAKLIAEHENWTYRASAENPLEKRAVRESFARSFIWSADIIAENTDGSLLVDISSFLTRDALSVVKILSDHPKGGSFSIAEDRTLPDVSQTLVFPDNVEFDVFLTLTGSDPKSEVTATAADGRSITLVQHISLIRLPDDDYQPRAFDVRSGSIDVPYYDFSAPLDGEIKQSHARRFRLQKIDPANPDSAVKEPIIFYVDSGAPEQIRDALIEGAGWWADAFAEAGFPEGYKVEALPEGVHPRDSRFNTILWTHRQTRGWSYGGGVHDPRTGEMIKANVILGSQRVRQDRMIFEGLAAAEKSGSGETDDPVEIALNRIRQLSAHEVGHTLGFAHNFAASSNDRASVMDYPAPLITANEDGTLDFSDAYDKGIGAWDKVSANWLYREFSDVAEEQGELEKILSDAYGSGLRFVGDREARSVGTAHPYASVWDNGEDAVSALEEAMRVRRIGLQNFSERSLQSGQPISNLRDVIVPIYLYHRYQIAAAAKYVGGYEFSYTIKGDALPGGTLVDDAEQRHALEVLLTTLSASELVLPDSLVNRLSPALGRFGAFAGGREAFKGDKGPVFDLINAADSAGTLTINTLLHPDRAARLVDFHSRDVSRLGLSEVLRAIENTVFTDYEITREQAIAQRLQARFVSTLMTLSAGAAAAGESQAAALGLSNGGGAVATPEVRAIVDAYLKTLRARITPGLLEGQSSDRVHREWLISQINRHLERPAPATLSVSPSPAIPPGSPIGSDAAELCWHCEPIKF